MKLKTVGYKLFTKNEEHEHILIDTIVNEFELLQHIHVVVKIVHVKDLC